MKRHRIITYFFQKICYHGNHITHSVEPPKSKAIVLLRELAGEIFYTLILHVTRNDRQKYVSLTKFCRRDESKNLLFDYCFFIFPTYRILKKGIYTHPIDLSCDQKFEKNSPTGSGNISARRKSRSTRSH